VDEGIKPLVARQDALEEKVTAAIAKTENLAKEAVRYDATGKQWLWGEGGEPIQAPAYLKSGANKSSKPLLLTNIWRATMAAAGSGARAVMGHYASEELAFSQKLIAAGYQSHYLGSILFPLGDELFLDRVNDTGQVVEDLSELRKEIRERCSLPRIDYGEIAHHLKKYPEFAEQFGLSRKDLQIGDDTLGGFLIPTTQSDRIIDLLRNRLSVMRAGAREEALPPTGNIAFPRLTSDPTFTYTDPDTTTDATTSNIGTGVVRLSAKSLRGYVTIPNDLLRYSSPSVEMVVRMALASKMAVAEDIQFLEGVGSALAPKGLLNYTVSAAETPTANKLTLHVASVSGANGDTFQPEDVMKILALYYMGNDPDPPTAFIMRPLLWAAIANRRADAVTAADGKGPFMFWTTRGSLGANVPEQLGGTAVVQTVQASKNRVEGSGTDLVYVLLGNFRRMIIGRVGTIEIAVSEHVKFLQDKTIIRAVGRHDMGLEHEESFVLTDTLLES